MAIYLGRCKQGDVVQFRSSTIPTKESHGHLYTALIGPYKCKVGASYVARHGQKDPLMAATSWTGVISPNISLWLLPMMIPMKGKSLDYWISI